MATRTRTPRERAPRRFQTSAQADRARDLAASGPLARRVIDAELDALGWTQRHDDDPNATDLTPDAQRAMYDRDGRLHDCFAPPARQSVERQISRARDMGRRAAAIGLARVPAFDAGLQAMLPSAEVAATMLLREWLTGYDHVVIERMMRDD